MHSTFALDVLTQIARRLTPDKFTATLSQIFGRDLPPHTLLALREDLLCGEVKNPPLILTDDLGYTADYDNRERIIRLDRGFFQRIEKGVDASWLLDALLHEFGHHIDNILRHDLSDPNSRQRLAADAIGEEGERFSYQMAQLGEFETDQVTIASSTNDYSHQKQETQVKWKQAASEILARYKHSQGNFDSGHRNPDREAFEAGHGDDRKKTHLQIEAILSTLGFSEDETEWVYFGNWLRDYSQLLDPKIVRATTMPKHFPDVLSREALTKIVDVLAVKQFRWRRSFPQVFTVTPQLLGVYRPSEHIDNPKVTDPKTEDPTTRDPDFEPLVLDGDALLEIDYQTSMKRYIARSVAFMKAELEIAMREKRTAEGLRAFGSALHVLEDFFAHSNFVELALIKNGHSNVVPWTSPADCKAGLPLVTGMFGPTDVLASLAGPLGDVLFSTEDVTYKPTKAGDRSPREQVLQILLEEHHNPSYLQTFNSYLVTRDAWADLPFVEFLQRSAHYLQGLSAVAGNGVGIIMKDMLKHLGENVDDWQTRYGQDPHLNGSTDPTHSQLAKDHAEHPLHLLAASLATQAVKEVALAMVAHWNGDPGADPVAVATSYFKHPQDSDWQDTEVIDWAQTTPDELRRSESKTELADISRALSDSGAKAVEQMRKDGKAYLMFLRGEFLDKNSPWWFLQSLTPTGRLSKEVLKFLGLI
ncbi:MAG TPA: HET-C-related protein [Pseudomonas sp.]|uniref:HET-C-related protein n=1 Tax=Pseudomonas sp. TaxID=306 RepID=UPI002EDAC315